ncbi:MAG: alpha/beta hydrolase [Clostridia bacterium]|nr:alpha/beta hydrolase [Clostridia bacterium]
MTILYLIIALAAGVLLVSYIVFRIVFLSPNGTQNDDCHLYDSPQMDPLRDTILDMIRAVNAMPFERAEFTAYDGLKLRGRYYHHGGGCPLAILFHGYRGTPSRDFAGGVQAYLDEGFNLLMIEERACCGSEGHVITFGVKERLDCLTWIDYARRRFGDQVRILLCGISMGASTVIMASGLQLPDNVKGIIADCPFTSPGQIIRKVCADMKIPARIAWPFIRLGARIYGRFDTDSADAEEAVRHKPVPILLIHGEDDRFVPCDMGRKIAAANPDMVELHTFPGAGHGLSFLIDKTRYVRIIRAFLDRVMADARG